MGDALKGAGISALVDTISGAIAEKIGQASNRLSPIEHKLAHFALGVGTGAILDRDNPLASGISGGAGAVIGETVAEPLVDRQQVMQEAKRQPMCWRIIFPQQDDLPAERSRFPRTW